MAPKSTSFLWPRYLGIFSGLLCDLDAVKMHWHPWNPVAQAVVPAAPLMGCHELGTLLHPIAYLLLT